MLLSRRSGEEYSLLPIAVCRASSSASVELSHSLPAEDAGYLRVPLVAEQIWKKLLKTYDRPVVKVVVESRPSIDESAPRCSKPLLTPCMLLFALRAHLHAMCNGGGPVERTVQMWKSSGLFLCNHFLVLLRCSS